MRKRIFCALSLAAWIATSADARPVLLISIDGLRPADVTEAAQRGLKVPHLRQFMRDGAWASGVHGVLPTVTYPSHTTLLTGVAPGKHGIVSNHPFDPLLKNQEGWFWYAADIKVPTLWDAAHAAHLSTVNVHWPVSVGANVDLNLPQYWRSGSADDRKLFAQLATPGLVAELEAKLGPYADGIDESVAGDVNRARFAQYLLETRKPDFMTMYLTALDHESHVSGPDTPQAHAALERIDGLIGELVDAAHRVAPDGVVAVVSDHGFTTLHDEVNLYTAFVDAGLIQTDNNGKVTHWDAMPWHNGGTAEIVLREGADEALRARVGEVLARLRSAPENGIDRVFDSAAIAKMGGDPHAAFFIAFKPGNMMSAERKQALHAPSQYRGMHGYAPDVPEMNATFLIEGKGIPAARALGEIDMRAIAPTLAKLLGVSLPQAESNPLFD